MGVVKESDRKDERGPECPHCFVGTVEKYRELKFIQRETGDTIHIYPRDMLEWSDLKAYKDITGHEISMLEAELIMGIDAIFEGREDG